ncbi:MAG TPA: TetR/AcrR family transcriptional regulator [Solirubrobacteraceae bacterium]|nr:TetR/AcrR family transcriptional regulator [Solirubrobacteraceae bacterium]
MERYSRSGRGRTRQQIAAQETKRAIVEGATRLFGTRGYHATSLGLIASEAGVAVQTIYNSVGSKRDVLSAVLDLAAAGEGAPVFSEPDPRRIIARLVEFWRGSLPRTARLLRVVGEAAAADPEGAALERARNGRELRGCADVARLLADRGALRTGLSVDHGAAAIFAIGHPETYRTLVLEGTWEGERWSAWARAALEAALLQS